ncbi:MAG: GGDEF domain-containing protein [Actinobacteria bacterium]|nr:MAG: GGDEF domain-containing protein [Actinomycetota bacterium]
MDGSISPRIAGRLAGALFVSCGALVGMTAPIMPAPPSANRPALVALALIAVATGALIWEMPWDRWSQAATLWLVPVAFSLIALHNFCAGNEGYRYPVFFFVTFAWLGASHPPRTSLKFLPLAGAAYLMPLVVADPSAEALSSAVFALPVCVFVGEAVAWMARRLRQTLTALDLANRALELAQAESQHRADLLATVARAGGAIASLQREQVLGAVVDSVLDLGLDAAAFCFFDDEAATYRVGHLRGLPDTLALRALPTTEGLAPRCRADGRTIIVEDYPAHTLAIPAIVEAGVRAAVLTPVRMDDTIPAVLIAAAFQPMALGGDTVESVELLAAQAGRALANAQTHEHERRTSQALAAATLRDELTGIGNRRHAAAMLESLLPGDAVGLLDLDHFKAVNDRDGHAAGDAVLVTMGDYLREHLRYEDSAARYGGEEFLVLLRQIPDRALETAERLVEGWRARQPGVTISMGVSVHRAEQSAAATLGHADAALYAAKRTGRDRVCEYALEDVDSATGEFSHESR